MAQRPQPTPPNAAIPIGFKDIQLFKDEILGIGSYGKVYRAKCDNLLCAAKIIHETLFDPTAVQHMPRGREHRHPIRRFELECEFLNTIRHPNVIQYLGMWQDPDVGLPVLLMELMDESLTNFLETATQSIPYHIQVNICGDVALALTFLHANGIIHRDLSSNNVLLIGNVRAKVTDFGMAKLGDLNPRMSHLSFTMCPGTDVYMPPEAVQDKPVYTEKIDCFSFGVIVIQMLTRQFPKPNDRMQRVEMNHPGLPRGTLMVCIPEVDRRQNHISLIDPNNTLLPIAFDCLKDRDVERPSAQQLCERVAGLKENDAYAESLRVSQTMVARREMQEQLHSLREQHTRELLRLQMVQAREQLSLREEHMKEIQKLRDIQLSEREAKENEIQDLLRAHDEAIAAKERENQQQRIQFEEIRHRMNEKVEELEEQLKKTKSDVPSKDQAQPETEEMPQKEADISLKWRREDKPAPQPMYRHHNAVVDEGAVYVNVYPYNEMYAYDIRHDGWIRLPDCPYQHSSFVVIDDKLTAIGGTTEGGHCHDSIYELNIDEWEFKYEYMPTARYSASAVNVGDVLVIVVGGQRDGQALVPCPVELLHIQTREWYFAANVPSKQVIDASAVICWDRLYVLGGQDSRAVYSCSLFDLAETCRLYKPADDLDSWRANQKACQEASSQVWKQHTNLPLVDSTCLSLNNHLLSIGGRFGDQDQNGGTSNAVFAYKPTTNSWELISEISESRANCFAVTFKDFCCTDKLMIVGGSSGDSIEFARLVH